MDINLLPERFRDIRTNLAKETQAEFSKSIQIDQKTVSRIENGAQHPNCTTLITMATKYNVDLNWLLGGPERSDTQDLQDHVAELESEKQELQERIEEQKENIRTFRLALETIAKQNRSNDANADHNQGNHYQTAK